MNDVVNHPSHYTDGKIEVIDFIEDKNLNFHRGNAVKYISRAGKKDPNKEVEDLKKARWYIDREIKKMTGETSTEKTSAGVDLKETLVAIIEELTEEQKKQKTTEYNAKRRGDTINEKIFGGVRIGLQLAIEKIERKIKV